MKGVPLSKRWDLGRPPRGAVLSAPAVHAQNGSAGEWSRLGLLPWMSFRGVPFALPSCVRP